MRQNPAKETAVEEDFEFSAEDIELLLANIDSYTPEEQEELLKTLDEYERKRKVEAARDDLIAFCCAMQPDYKVGKHHRILGDLLMEIEQGREYEYDGKPGKHWKRPYMCEYAPKTRQIAACFYLFPRVVLG